jgi:hypothetical protein
MNCHDARIELAARLPREPLADPLRTHLAECAACRAAADRLAVVDARLGAHFGRLEPRAAFDARLRAAIARAEQERRAGARSAIDAPDLEPARRLLRAGSILDGIAAVGMGGTVIALVVHSQDTLVSWLESAASGHGGTLATSPAVVLGTVTIACVATMVGGAARWVLSQRD